jgi:hypothetical protein
MRRAGVGERRRRRGESAEIHFERSGVTEFVMRDSIVSETDALRKRRPVKMSVGERNFIALFQYPGNAINFQSRRCFARCAQRW